MLSPSCIQPDTAHLNSTANTLQGKKSHDIRTPDTHSKGFAIVGKGNRTPKHIAVCFHNVVLAHLNSTANTLQGKKSHVSLPIILLPISPRTNCESIAVKRETYRPPEHNITFCIVAVDAWTSSCQLDPSRYRFYRPPLEIEMMHQYYHYYMVLRLQWLIYLLTGTLINQNYPQLLHHQYPCQSVPNSYHRHPDSKS